MANVVRGKGSGSQTQDKNKTTGSSSISSSGSGSVGTSGGGSVSGGSYANASNNYLSQKYTGGNAQLDAALHTWSDRYFAARAAGDATGMRNANDEANKLRNQYGYAAEHADQDIAKIAGQNQNQYGSSGGIGSAGYSGTLPRVPDLGQADDLSSYLQDMYEAQRQAAISQIDSAYQQNLSAIDRAKQGVDSQYQSARNQAAGSSAQAARNFNEYAAAAGLGSGTGAQAELARNVALQNSLNTINVQEADTYADLELQRVNAETQYNSAIAQAQASGDAALAQALYQEKVRVQQDLLNRQLQQYQLELQNYQLQYQAGRDAVADQQWQQQFEFNAGQADLANQQWQQQFDASNSQWQQSFDLSKDQWQQEFDYSTSTAQRQQLADYGNAFLQQGLMGSQEMLAAMGISSQDAQRYLNQLQYQVALAAQSSGSTSRRSSGGSGGSKSSGGSGGSSMTLTTAKQAAAAGNFEDAVIATLKKNGYSDGMLQSIYGYDPYQSDFKKATGSYRYDKPGTLFTASEYNRFVNEVMGNRTPEGREATIWDAANEGKITEQQFSDLLSKYV